MVTVAHLIEVVHILAQVIILAEAVHILAQVVALQIEGAHILAQVEDQIEEVEHQAAVEVVAAVVVVDN